jgi:hypothetical protein
LAGTFREQRIVLNAIRFLANDLRIPLVCVGTHEAKQALMTDQQLADRFRFLMQHLMTATNHPLPLFCRIADADPHLRRYLFGRQRPGTRMEAMSWYWRFLLMIILVTRLLGLIQGRR